MATFYFEGHATVGQFVRKHLEAIDCFEVTDPTEADAIFTYFVSQNDVENAYLDSEGLMQIAQQDALLIDLSPITPGFARELNALAQVDGLKFVEAPLAVVTTTLPDAFDVDGNVACCVAGADDALEAARPFLAAMFSQIHTFSGAGAAQLAHAAYAVQLASLMVASAEAFALFQADGGSAADAFAGGCADDACGCGEGAPAKRPPALTMESQVIMDALCAQGFAGSFTSEMLRADLAAALGAAEDAELTLPQAEVCMNLLELLAVAGGSDLNPAALALDYAPEEEVAAFGLDWSHVDEVYALHDHDHDDDDDDYDYDDDDDYDDLDDDIDYDEDDD